MERGETDRRRGEEAMEEGVNAAEVSQLVNGLEKQPTQKELMCVDLFKAGVFVCVCW